MEFSAYDIGSPNFAGAGRGLNPRLCAWSTRVLTAVPPNTCPPRNLENSIILATNEEKIEKTIKLCSYNSYDCASCLKLGHPENNTVSLYDIAKQQIDTESTPTTVPKFYTSTNFKSL
ncbi:unnamed protein product [Trichobilharzia regenti]|nr:unnamed protein product [Trichobilharzia regenti]